MPASAGLSRAHLRGPDFSGRDLPGFGAKSRPGLVGRFSDIRNPVSRADQTGSVRRQTGSRSAAEVAVEARRRRSNRTYGHAEFAADDRAAIYAGVIGLRASERTCSVSGSLTFG